MTEKPDVEIKIDRVPKSQWKALGGSDHDQWNERLVGLVTTDDRIRQKSVMACREHARPQLQRHRDASEREAAASSRRTTRFSAPKGSPVARP